MDSIELNSDQSQYLMLRIVKNKHIVILTDVSGNEFGKGSGLSTLEAINNYYDTNRKLNAAHLLD